MMLLTTISVLVVLAAIIVLSLDVGVKQVIKDFWMPFLLCILICVILDIIFKF